MDHTHLPHFSLIRLLKPFLAFAGLSFLNAADLPNILFILADDLGYGDTSLYGSSVVTTPSIESIAQDGVLFPQGYVASPVCGPSRAALMVSWYPSRMGMLNNAVGDEHLDEIPSGQTMASLLKAKGYKTCAIGKWHLGNNAGLYPSNRGFDEFFGFYGGRNSYYPTNAPGEAVHLDASNNVKFGGTITHLPGQGIVRNGNPVAEPSHLTDAFTREALAYLDTNADGNQPFFMYLAYNAPHNPYQCPKSYYDKYPNIADGEARVYAGMIDQLDESIGKVLAKLQEKGIAENTVVIFLSDNGTPVSSPGSNAPLRGGKFMTYEGGVRVPFAIKWPGKYPSGKIVASPVTSLDLLPTLAVNAGYTQQELIDNYHIDGSDISPLVQSATLADNFDDGDRAGWTAYNGTWPVSDGELLFAPGASEGKLILDGTMMGDFCYEADIVPQSGVNGLIFNATDIGTGSNGYHGYRAVLRQGASDVQVIRVDAGTQTVLAAVPRALDATTSYHLRVCRRGKTLTLYLEDMATPLATLTDDTYRDGAFGVCGLSAASSATFDNIRLAPWASMFWSYLTDDNTPELRSGTRDGDFKYVVIQQSNGDVAEGLYDLATDIGEASNLANNASYTQTFSQLKTLHARWLTEVSTPPPAAISVDFSTHAYFPLVKERIALFQEGSILQGEETLINNIEQMEGLPITDFRILCRLSNGASFNGPNQVFSQNGQIQTRINADLDTTFQMLRERGITPAISWFGIPPALQGGGTGGVTGLPTDFAAYGSALADLAELYAQKGNLIFEVYNEPDLENYIVTDDHAGDYWKLFKAIAPAVRAKNPDILVAGPVASNGASSAFLNTFVADFLTEKQQNPDLPLDLFSVHLYGPVNDAVTKLATIRNAVQDQFNDVPFIVTEYENFRPIDSDADKEIREVTRGAVHFLRHVKMLTEQTDVAKVYWNRFISTGPADSNANPGGMLSYEGVKRAIYNAYKLWGWLPTDRNTAIITDPNNQIEAMAGSDGHNAGILLWNSGDAPREVELRLTNIPPAIINQGRLRLYRIDREHASADEGAPGELAVERTQTVNSSDLTTTVTVDGPGIYYLRLDDQSGSALRNRHVLDSAKYIRSWQWAPRTPSGSSYVNRGNYGTFDPANWILRVGTGVATGRGIAGVTMEHTPSKLWIRFASYNVSRATEFQVMQGVRIDYWQNETWEKSVLYYGDGSVLERTVNVPWGKNGTGDVLLSMGTRIGDGTPFPVDIDAYAPTGWTTGTARRCLVTAWTQATGIDAQSVVTLSDGTDAIAEPLADWDEDGRSNLLELALGTDPLSPDYIADSFAAHGTDIIFRHLREPGFEYRAQFSEELKTWTTIWSTSDGWVEPSIVSRVEGTDYDTITIHNPDPTVGPRGFWRLLITQNPLP